MLLLCPACNQNADLKIRKKTSEVVCTECNKTVEITSFMKGTMISRGDFLVDTKTAFAFECKKCGQATRGDYDKKLNQVICNVCSTPMNVTQHMLLVLKNLKLSGQDIELSSSTRTLA